MTTEQLSNKDSGNGKVTLAVLGVKLDVLVKDLVRLFSKMEELQAAFNEHCIHSTMSDSRIEVLETSTGTNRANIAALAADMKQLQKDLQTTNDEMQPLITMLRVAVFLSGAIGMSFIGLMWAVFTGQVTLVFP
jgi:uncharacterized coiled-coil protein SlyX